MVYRDLTRHLCSAGVIRSRTITLTLQGAIYADGDLRRNVNFRQLIRVRAKRALCVGTHRPRNASRRRPRQVLTILRFFVRLPLFRFNAIQRGVRPPLFRNLRLILLLASRRYRFNFFCPYRFTNGLLYFLLNHYTLPNFRLPSLYLPTFLRVIMRPRANSLVRTSRRHLTTNPGIEMVLRGIPYGKARPFVYNRGVSLLYGLTFRLFLLQKVGINYFGNVRGPPNSLQLIRLNSLVHAILVVRQRHYTILRHPLRIVRQRVPTGNTLNSVIVYRG